MSWAKLFSTLTVVESPIKSSHSNAAFQIENGFEILHLKRRTSLALWLNLTRTPIELDDHDATLHETNHSGIDLRRLFFQGRRQPCLIPNSRQH